MRQVGRLAIVAAFAFLPPSTGAGEASAQASLDAPVVRVAATTRTSVTVEVEAGASGAPAGFTVQWMKKADHDRLGGWPAQGDATVRVADFIGAPTLNPSTGSYVLSAGGNVQVELGDLYDETGLITNYVQEMASGEASIIRARVRAAGGLAASGFSPELLATTQPVHPANCTYTLGYWKTHPGAWPVGGLTVGGVPYTQTQLLDILNRPARGNGLVILAHQLIATKLNLANGADPTPVAAAVAQADVLVGMLVPPPVGSDWLDPSAVNQTKDVLDSYNNGLLGVPHCGAVPATVTTWGGLKAVYR